MIVHVMRTCLLALCVFVLSETAHALELQVIYLERPPYYWTKDALPTGFLLDLTQKFFQRAGVTASFEALPPKRIIEELRANDIALCSIGWFKNPERETFATFSLPIYRDKRLVLLTTKAKANLFTDHRTLQDVFLDRSLVLAQMASFSYGETVDKLMNEALVRNLTISTTQSVLPRLIFQNRADYMLLAPEEVTTLLNSAGLNPDDFVQLNMDGIPAGNLRYLMFSRKVPLEIVTQINIAIEALTNQSALLDGAQP